MRSETTQLHLREPTSIQIGVSVVPMEHSSVIQKTESVSAECLSIMFIVYVVQSVKLVEGWDKVGEKGSVQPEKRLGFRVSGTRRIPDAPCRSHSPLVVPAT